MRVPISLADLREKRGFNRIAKKLQKNWPGPDSLTLSLAHEVAAQGLGYRDYHDLQQSAEKNEPSSHAPTATDVRAGLTTSILAFCQTGKVTGVGETDFDLLAASLPIQELAIFQHLNTGPSSKVRRISTEQLVSLGNLVRLRGGLRDQCLFVMLLSGITVARIEAVKAQDISVSESIVRIKLAGDELTGQPRYARSFHHIWPIVTDYIDQEDLSPDDYLFPSRLGKTVPMSSREMNKLICSYLKQALPDPAYWTARRFRQSLLWDFIEPMDQQEHTGSWFARPPVVPASI
ncbi:phage integrase family protein [Pseudomonas abietaniphila]|uniref:Tyr recombinase domain-containing protein n=1 Tax=Pseudomonas abietaniphila TaxID=89065 RepID=A0A1G8MMU2_9PSED|nr:phage integrase family protein [Pseudomonas abietaniphila]SDI69197.1 hypothetical protein SAMN05216605_1166 [Pseudomonas abietaniphila]